MKEDLQAQPLPAGLRIARGARGGVVPWSHRSRWGDCVAYAIPSHCAAKPSIAPAASTFRKLT